MDHLNIEIGLMLQDIESLNMFSTNIINISPFLMGTERKMSKEDETIKQLKELNDQIEYSNERLKRIDKWTYGCKFWLVFIIVVSFLPAALLFFAFWGSR